MLHGTGKELETVMNSQKRYKKCYTIWGNVDLDFSNFTLNSKLQSVHWRDYNRAFWDNFPCKKSLMSIFYLTHTVLKNTTL